MSKEYEKAKKFYLKGEADLGVFKNELDWDDRGAVFLIGDLAPAQDRVPLFLESQPCSRPPPSRPPHRTVQQQARRPATRRNRPRT